MCLGTLQEVSPALQCALHPIPHPAYPPPCHHSQSLASDLATSPFHIPDASHCCHVIKRPTLLLLGMHHMVMFGQSTPVAFHGAYLSHI